MDRVADNPSQYSFVFPAPNPVPNVPMLIANNGENMVNSDQPAAPENSTPTVEEPSSDNEDDEV